MISLTCTAEIFQIGAGLSGYIAEYGATLSFDEKSVIRWFRELDPARAA